MNSELFVPNDSNFGSLINSSEKYVMPACMSSCRGCQCRENAIQTEDLFEEDVLFSPSEVQYKTILDKFSSEPEFVAGGCTCNCTACNSCRCDCSCRVGKDFFEELDNVWN